MQYVRIYNPNTNGFYQMLRSDVSSAVVDMGAQVSDVPWPGLELKTVNHEHRHFGKDETTVTE